jgi:hypothetical protein
MKSEPVPDTTLPEPSDDVRVAREDTHAPDRDDAIASQADALALDPYSPLEPTWDYLAGIRAL